MFAWRDFKTAQLKSFLDKSIYKDVRFIVMDSNVGEQLFSNTW